MLIDLLLAVAAGSLTTLNPCVLPLLPLVVAGAMAQSRWAPLAMGAGLALSYALLGLFVALLGESIGLDANRLRWIGGVLLVLFGVVQLVPALNDRFTLLLSPVANKAHAAAPSMGEAMGESMSGSMAGSAAGSLWTSFLTGALLGLAWSPCSGPLLGSALTLVADAGTANGIGRGTLILGFFGLGAAAPLVGVAYLSKSKFLSFRDWMLKHSAAIKKAVGFLMLALGLAILTGYDKRLEGFLVNLMPDWLIAVTTKI
jgi:cytochrome c biogenesis protein CcdA